MTAKRFFTIILFALLTAGMGFVAGLLIRLVLLVISLGTGAVWTHLPRLFGLEHSLPYYLGACLLGGLLIGLWQRRFGIFPDTLEEVIGRVKGTGTYPYDRLPVIAVAAILPLIFGGALGPEAGLTGLIAGFCCMIGDHLKIKGDRLAALTEAGLAATLGVIFGAPFFGIAAHLEPDDSTEHYREKLVSRKTRILIYCFGVAGGMAAFALAGLFLPSVGLPRFDPEHAIGIHQWVWFVPLLALGIIACLYYQSLAALMRFLGKKIASHRIVSCLIAGVAVAVCGWFIPLSMFSGEHQLEDLIAGYGDLTIPVLAISAAAKLFLVSVCINFGWKGGNIFPIIYSSALLGYDFAAITGMDGTFAVAILTASFYAYLMRKPVTVMAILLLCFPVTYIIPIGISAFLASKIPSPFRNHPITHS